MPYFYSLTIFILNPMKSLILAALGSLALLSGCESHRSAYVEQPYDMQPVTTTVVQPQPAYGGTTVIHDHDDNNGLVTGLILGHALSSNSSGGGYGGGGNDYSRTKRTKNVTINNHTTVVQRTPTGTMRTQASSSTRTSYRPSSTRSSSSMSSRAVRRRR